MIDISLDKNYNLYTNWIDSYNFLDKINDNTYNYPKEIVNFHIYSEIKTEKELECIKSLLATQNLKKINLILYFLFFSIAKLSTNWKNYKMNVLDFLYVFY